MLVKKTHSRDFFSHEIERMQHPLVDVAEESPAASSYPGNDAILLQRAQMEWYSQTINFSRVRIISSRRSVHLISFERYTDSFLACSYLFYSPEFWRGHHT